MKNKTATGAALAGIIIGGLAYWSQPYTQPAAFGINMWVLMGAGAFLGALVFMMFLHEEIQPRENTKKRYHHPITRKPELN